MKSSKFGGEVLENPVILQHFFYLLRTSSTSVQHLKNVRLVSQTWHRESLSLWRKSAVLFLQETPLFNAHGTQGISPSRYWEELQNPNSSYQLKEKPFHKYKLQKLFIDLKFCSESAKPNAFWSAVGPHMRQLTLRDVKFDIGSSNTTLSSEQFVIQWLFTTLPNLEALFLEQVHTSLNHNPAIVDIDEGDARVKLPVHQKVKWLSLDDSLDVQAAQFPNLEQLTFHVKARLDFFLGTPGAHPGYLENAAIKRLDLIRCDFVQCSIPLRLPALEHLAFSVGSFNEEQSRIYNQTNFPTILVDLLESSAGTLRTLQVFNTLVLPPKRTPLFQVDFPHLTELKLYGNVVWDLNFLRLMPHLQLLHVDYYGFTKKEMMRQRISSCSSSRRQQHLPLPIIRCGPVKRTVQSGLLTGMVLDKLENLYINFALDAESVRVLGEWMPNLRILKGVFNGEALKVVSQMWRELEELHCLYRSRIQDADILERGLTRMEHLRRFYYDQECDASVLTDDCVAEGFLQMLRLTELKICVSEKFSEVAEAALQEKIETVQVIRNYLENPAHQNWSCCEDAKHDSMVFDDAQESSQR